MLLVGWSVGRRYGPNFGCLAAVLLPLMPRLWGHAHLASLETITNLMYTAAVLSIAMGWNNESPPTWRAGLLAGIVLGLAFLTKIQAILLPMPIIAWALWRWRWAAVKPLAIWAVAAAIVFFVGWPWLWLDPVKNTWNYFAHTTARAELSVWYFGIKYADKAVPWSYPWVMFLCTLPMATLVLGLRGILFGVASEEKANDVAWRALLAANVAFPLIVFSLPGVAVYDGDRLFLTVFPFWAMLSARGAIPGGTVSPQPRRDLLFRILAGRAGLECLRLPAVPVEFLQYPRRRSQRGRETGIGDNLLGRQPDAVSAGRRRSACSRRRYGSRRAGAASISIG